MTKAILPATVMAGPGLGFHPHLPGTMHTFFGKAIGATMWFYLFYQGRKHGPVLLGWRHPWEHPGHNGHENHH